VAPLVAGRPHAMSLAGWLAWAAIALVILGAIVRVAEVVWGAACTAYVLVRSLVAALGSAPSRPSINSKYILYLIIY
jgi:hypothetical protein